MHEQVQWGTGTVFRHRETSVLHTVRNVYRGNNRVYYDLNGTLLTREQISEDYERLHLHVDAPGGTFR